LHSNGPIALFALRSLPSNRSIRHNMLCMRKSRGPAIEPWGTQCSTPPQS
jgi:hypothetical protein